MAEAILQNGALNGLSDENQPPTENHVNSYEDKGMTSADEKPAEGGSDDVAKSEKKDKERSDKDRHRSSGHHSSHKSSHRDKDRHHSSSKHSSSSKPHSSSSSSKHHSSSSSSKDKDGHRSSSSHHKSSSKDKDRSSSSSKHHSSSSSKHHSSSSSSKDKHHSSSSSKHRDGHHSSSSSKHHSSSSSKHKSSHHDKHRSDKDKHRSSSSSHKSSSSSHQSSDKKPVEVKSEPVIKEEPMDVTDAPVKSEPVSPEKSFKVERDAGGDSEDEMPLSARKAQKASYSESEDDEPLSARAEKIKKEKHDDVSAKKRKQDYDEDFSPEPKKKKMKEEKKVKKAAKPVKQEVTSPVKRKKKEQGEGDADKKWKWWEEEPKQSGVKWSFLEHKGPVFAPPYEPLPDNVKFYYDGEEMELSEPAEEVAGFYARMLEHEYTTRDVFNSNFFKDWKKTMTKEEKSTITDLSKCNFKEIYEYYKMKSEERKNRSKEEKKAEKEANAALVEEYGFCDMDGHKEKIGNFRIEPPGLFRGRGDHPKQGMLKTRTLPEDIIINCSKDSKIPQPPPGHRWKEVRHDNTVTWLASWNENIQGNTKYIMLGATSKLKGAKDWQKYETARKLHKIVDKIRATYREDFKSKEMRIRQRAVALYFIDKLALRAGNEKDGDETADTVGCCSLRVEHINLHEEKDGQEYVVEFDFLGKDSIRYYNKIPVEKRVFKNLQLFTENKSDGDDLFDRLNTSIMNKHLQSLMDGLTAKVFRTYNASRTLQEQLNLLTQEEDGVAAKMLSYNRANRAVAVLCNHQRAAPKNFGKQMENLQKKIDAKKDAIKDAKRDVKAAKADLKASKSVKAKTTLEKKKKAVQRLEEQLVKLEVQSTDKEENKEIALGTSKLNYLDPRISVSWCKKWGVPIEKVYNKTQREKFAWAIDMTEEDYDFTQMEDED